MVFLFYMLGQATEKYLVPILNQISELLKLSQNVAGVTFLALAKYFPVIAYSHFETGTHYTRAHA